MKFTVLGIPVQQGNLRTSKQGRSYHADKGLKPWRASVAANAYNALGSRAFFEGPVVVLVSFVFPKPKSAPKRRRYPEVQPDLDKLVRAIFDALEGVVFRSDAQVVTLRAEKRYGMPARAEVEVVEQP